MSLNFISKFVIVFLILFSLYKNSFAYINELEINKETGLNAKQIVNNLEKRYDVTGFESKFEQTIILNNRSKEITNGKIYVLTPNNIKWEYDNPKAQNIIYTNGDIYFFDLLNNQLVVTNSKSFTKNGLDVSFIANMNSLLEKFHVSLELNLKQEKLYKLKLVPKTQAVNLFDMYIEISKKNFDIISLKAISAYGDKINIEFKDMNLNSIPNLNIFKVNISENIDVIEFYN